MVRVRSKLVNKPRIQLKRSVFIGGICVLLTLLLLVLFFVTVSILHVFDFYEHVESHKQQSVRDSKASHHYFSQNITTTTTTTIAYAVTVTGCGTDPLTEGAAVLQHSIRTRASRHQADFVVFYPPEARECVQPLQRLGFLLKERHVFVNVSDIRGEFLRTHISQNGCCGEKELLKLEAYTLVEYPVVVHLDLDVLIWQSMDDLFDAMLLQQPLPLYILQRPEILPPTQINAFFTYDYNMVQPKVQYKPVQGGFLVLRPSLQVYQEYRDIVLEGDFRPGQGWGGQVGPFYGSMTFQGIVPYYYNVLKGGKESVELNRCMYNQMADNPRTGKTVHDQVRGTCRTNTETCEDCRERSLTDIVTAHFTLCQKPWWCVPHTAPVLQHRLCRQLTHAWYQVRSELEQSWGRSGRGPGLYDVEQFYGFCTKQGKDGYVSMELP